MPIVAGFKQVKKGVSYNGVMINYIVVDTRNNLHLMPFSNLILDTPSPVTELKGDITLTTETNSRDRADIHWLWESLK